MTGLPPHDSAKLRRAALARLDAQPAAKSIKTESDLRKLQHELEVHQIELEMQNAELLSARTETEKALELYADLYDFAPAGYLTLDLKGLIQLVNLTGARLLGVERTQLAKRPFRHFVAVADRRGFGEFLARVFAGAAKESCEVTLAPSGKGAPAPVVQIEAKRTAGGRECRAVLIDVTERKQQEAALRESEGKFRALFNSSSDSMVLLDEQKFFDCNPATLVIFGCATREEFCSYAPADLSPPLQPGGADSRTLARAHVAAALAKGHQRFEWLHRRADTGATFPAEVSLSAVELGGRLTLQAVVRDITKRKQLEAALENRLTALTRPLNEPEGITFEELFDAAAIQRIQDEFSAATGVASIITRPDGTPLTRPSNFCRLCQDIIRDNAIGLRNCHVSDKIIGASHSNNPTIQPCLSGGLWDAGTSIRVGDRHIANWLIGQVRDEAQTEEKMRAYARTIGADEAAVVEAFLEVPTMSLLRFTQVTQALCTLANQLSTIAYQNVQQARFIVDRTKAETALRASEENYRLLFTSMLDGFALHEIVCDAAGRPADYRFLSVNPAFERLTGLRATAVVGRTVLEIMPQTEPIWIERYGRVALTGAGVTFEEYSGTLQRHFEITAFRHKPGQFATIFIDITERKQAAARLQLQSVALNAAANAIFITDRNGTIEWANAAFTTFTGYTAAETIGKRPGQLLRSGKQDAALFKAMWETILAGRVWHGELANRRKDGSLYQAEMTVTPIRDESGVITQFIAVKQDITKRKMLEQQFRQAQKMEAIGQLAGGVAHDFNNILAAVLMYLGLLQDEPSLTPGTRTSLKELGKEIQRGAALTRQLLAFSRQQAMEIQWLNLTTVVAGLLKMLRRLLGENIKIVVEQEPATAGVEADAGMMEQVLMNLCINARDAMPRGGALTIRTKSVTLAPGASTEPSGGRAGRFVRLTVTDTGEGMSDETLQHLFEPFFTTKGVGKGTGLGLATVYGIVQQHRGWVTVESVLGQGSSFHVHLPACDAPAHAARSGTTPAQSASGRGETILLAEDEESLRITMALTLRRHGYLVLEAPDGPAALQLWRQHSATIALLLTDVVMPNGMSGHELIDRLRAEMPGLKVIATTGYSKHLVGSQFSPESLVTMLRKPFDPTELLNTIRARLDQA